MKKTDLEKQLDDRFAEIDFPDADDKTLPPATMDIISHHVGAFYAGAVLVVVQKPNGLIIWADPKMTWPTVP